MDITAIWKPEYSVGHQEIDAQHKYLFELWLMLDSIKDQEDNHLSLEQALLSLFDYVEVHFANEEQYLQPHPEFKQHQQIHADFIAQCTTFMEQFGRDALDTHTVVDYLRNWLIEHIVETDIRYFRELKEHS
ncbi:MAG TPA: bacteriohemerythrin [Desulfobulbus sp.]|nr:bacteriohemerythrin [Desulfobulbus sp.]